MDERQFDALSGLADGVVPPPPRSAAAARRTARRRQGARLAGAGLVVAAVVVGVPLGLSLGSPVTAPLPPATEVATDPATGRPAPSPSADAAPGTPSAVPAPPTVAAVASVPPSPSAGPGPTRPGGADPGPPVAPTIGPITATDSGPAAAGELVGLDPRAVGLPEVSPEADQGGDAGWALDPCRPTAYPQDVRRTGWWSQWDYIGDGGASRQVALFPDEVTAQAAVDGFVRVTEACWTPWQASPLPETVSTIWRAYPTEGPGLLGVARDYAPPAPVEEGGDRPLAQFVSAVRDGRAVAVVVHHHEFGGGRVAVAQGDDRPGAGAAAFSGRLTAGELETSVQESLAGARAEAVGLAGAALQHASAGG